MPSPAQHGQEGEDGGGIVSVKQQRRKSSSSLPRRLRGQTNCLRLLEKVHHADAYQQGPPITRIQNSSRSRKSIRKVMLKPAMAPYSASAVAARSPKSGRKDVPCESVREAPQHVHRPNRHRNRQARMKTFRQQPQADPLAPHPHQLTVSGGVGQAVAARRSTQPDPRRVSQSGLPCPVMYCMMLQKTRVNVCARTGPLLTAGGFSANSGSRSVI